MEIVLVNRKVAKNTMSEGQERAGSFEIYARNYSLSFFFFFSFFF